MNEMDYDFRKAMARRILSAGETGVAEEFGGEIALSRAELFVPRMAVPFPRHLTPTPTPITPRPASADKLPGVDVVVVTWTVAEHEALATVLTPGFPRVKWYPYDRLFEGKYLPQIRKGAPAYNSRRLGSYFLTGIGGKKVLCFKSELHLNQDGIQNYQGTDQTSLPVRDLLRQIIEETGCALIITAGTCGGIRADHDLGDVLVTRAARFRCQQEFANAPFNHRTFVSKWEVPGAHFDLAERLMKDFAGNLAEPEFGPPTKRHAGRNWLLDKPYDPGILYEGATADPYYPRLHPILTTDYFEFGHSGNAENLWREGCGVEMGDAVLGLVCSEDLVAAPNWLVVRNLSDPQINGEITSSPRNLDMQIHWAVWYYETYGYWTSVMSSLATWAVVAGLD